MGFSAGGVYTAPTGAINANPGDLIKSATWNSIFTDISSAMTLLGVQLYGTTAVTSTPYVPVATDSLLLVNDAAPVVINLPSATSRAGYPLRIKDNSGNAATNPITINRNGADTIEGATSVTISSNWAEIKLTPVTAGWIVETTNVQIILPVTGGDTAILGTLATQVLANTGAAILYNQVANGAILQGDGSSFDLTLFNKSGTAALQVPTGTQNVTLLGSALSTSATGGVGYGTGAGGTVTQITSRATGVTLNKTTGAITLFTVAPVVNTPVTFTVTNSSVAATDLVAVVVRSSNAGNFYEAFVTAVAAGSFNITVNSTLGANSDAPVLNFAVIKGSAT